MSAGSGLPAYIGLGSNLDDPSKQVRRALGQLDRIPRTRLRAVSSLYRSAPMGPPAQPDFVNAVACLHTALDPETLLRALQAIETLQGRVRTGERWGPRTLDLDLLLFGQRVLASPGLTVPHPGLHQRAFVLYPLLEIAPADLEVPGRGSLRELTRGCASDGLERLGAARPAESVR